jgi:hypothetical protein
MKAYEATIRNTATKRAPWYVVPADNKWFTRVVVAAAIIAEASLDLSIPKSKAATRGTRDRDKMMAEAAVLAAGSKLHSARKLALAFKQALASCAWAWPAAELRAPLAAP